MASKRIDSNILLRRAAQMYQSDIEQHLTAATERGDLAEADKAKDDLIPFYETIQIIRKNLKEHNG